jgi:hypothetical protein
MTTHESSGERIANSLRDVRELENFFFQLLRALPERRLRQGDDVLAHAKELGLEIPDFLDGEEVTWDTQSKFEEEFGGPGDQLVLVRPGEPTALGLTIGCIRWRRWKVCLECGWLYCRIVIKGTF